MEKLVEHNDTTRLSEKMKNEISDEIGRFIKMLNLGLSTKTEIQIDGSLFSGLSTSLLENCPLLFEVVESLLLTDSSG